VKHSILKTSCTPVALLVSLSAGAGAQEKLDRTTLPIQEPARPTYSELDVRNAKAPPRFEVKAPKNAPNVVIVLIDDVGFGATSTFGGPIQTPTLDRLASAGLTYNNFHTTALCSDHGDRDCIPGKHRADPEQRCAFGRDAPAQRLQHRSVRQVA